MPTIRLPTDLPPRILRRLAHELDHAARVAGIEAAAAEAAEREAADRRGRLRKALEARRTRAARVRAQVIRELLEAAPAARVAAAAGLSVRQVQRIRAAALARL